MHRSTDLQQSKDSCHYLLVMASGLLDPYFASTIHLSALKLEESMGAISTDGAYSTTCISIGVNKSNKLYIHKNTDK